MRKLNKINCNKKRQRTGYNLSKNQRKILLTSYKFISQHETYISKNDLQKELNLTKRIIYYSVNKLLKWELLENKSQGVLLLDITEKGKALLNSLYNDLQNHNWYVNSFLDRAHNISITQEVISRGNVPPNFIISEKSGNLNWDKPQLIHHDKENNLSLQISPKNLVYHFSQKWGSDPNHIASTCLNTCFEYSKLLIKHGWHLDFPRFTTKSQHHALYNNSLAKYTARFKIHYKSDRLEFDKSVYPNEIELIHACHSTDDFLKLTELFESVIRDDIKVSDLRELTSYLPLLRKLQAEHI